MDQFCVTGWEPDPICECPVVVDGNVTLQAQLLLWAATGRQYGLCTRTVTPCWVPSGCSAWCGVDYTRIRLDAPIHSIVEVTVDGAVVDPATYHVADYLWLVSTGDPWPVDLSDTLVEYVQGFAPPVGAGAVVAELACELAKAVCDDSSCRLPRRIVAKTRQGVTITYDDITGSGKTGIWSVDSWIVAASPGQAPPRMWSPDVCEPSEITWEAGP